MKTVLSPQQVAHVWANQLQDSARNSGSTFYFESKTIYSYGSHFAIAKHVTNAKGEDAILFTTRSYSNTTHKHVGVVGMAARHLKRISCPYPDGTAKDNFAYWLERMRTKAQMLANARKPAKYITAINAEYEQAKTYTEFFGYDIPQALTDLNDVRNMNEYAEALQKETERKNIALALQKVKAQKEFNKNLAKWRKREFSGFLRDPEGIDYLRYNSITERAETSQGVQIPIDIALKFYDIVTSTIDNGGCTNCNMRLLDYSVTEINKDFIVVGCHKINVKEITRFYKSLQIITA